MPDAERVEVAVLGESFFRVVPRDGFMDDPSVPEALGKIRVEGLDCAPRAPPPSRGARG